MNIKHSLFFSSTLLLISSFSYASISKNSFDSTTERVVFCSRQISNEQAEKKILIENCYTIASRARMIAGGCESHLIGLYITTYLRSVGTPVALQLLQELQRTNFHGF